MTKVLDKTTMKPSTPVGSFELLQRQIDRLFDDFSHGFEWPRLPTFSETDLTPAMEMTQTDKSVMVSAELPGVDIKDIDISVTGDMLTISGEKRSETEHKTGERHVTERTYGSFSRSMSLPFEIDPDLVKARFDKGVLKLEVGKPAKAIERTRKIEIKS